MAIKTTGSKDCSCKGMHFFDILGEERYMCVGELKVLMSNKHYLLFDGAVAAFLIIADPFGFRLEMSIGLTVIFWVLLVAFAKLIYMAVVFFAISIFSNYSKTILYFPVIGVTVMTVSTISINFMLSLVSEIEFNKQTALNYIYLPVLLDLIIEAIYFKFVRPSVKGLTVFYPRSPTVMSSEITISGQNISAADVVSLRSHDHYVEIKSVSENFLIRSRLSDVVDHFDPELGTQTHRSHWVAWSAVKKITLQPSCRQIELVDGEIIPVSLSRKATVREGANKNGIMVSE